MESETISTQTIHKAILLTLGATFIFAFLNYGPRDPGMPQLFLDIFPLFPGNPPWLVILLYLLFHPIIGKIFSVIIEVFCNANDKIYKFDDKNSWGNWEKTYRLYVAVLWPITAPIGVTITLLALIYGLLFKGLFR